MVTYHLYKSSIATNNDISSFIYDMGSFSYKINDDFTFELPELVFSSSIEIDKMENIFITDSIGNQIQFYVLKRTWNQQKRMFEYICPHILHKLTYVKARHFGWPFEEWCDISPGYDLYNSQTGYEQGQDVWGRQYWQCLFMIKMMIHYVTGISISTVDSSSIDDEDSLYYIRAYSMGQYNTTILKYKKLGCNMNTTWHMGTNSHLQYLSSDFIDSYNLPDCLNLLRYICASLMITINIMSPNYEIQEWASLQPPMDSDCLSIEETLIEAYRLYEVTEKRASGQGFDWIFGYYNDLNQLVYYTYGVDNPDLEIIESKGISENTSILNTKNLAITYPNFFRIYWIIISGYQSHTSYIYDAEGGFQENRMLANNIKNHWANIINKTKYETALNGLLFKCPYTEIDLSARRFRYETVK